MVTTLDIQYLLIHRILEMKLLFCIFSLSIIFYCPSLHFIALAHVIGSIYAPCWTTAPTDVMLSVFSLEIWAFFYNHLFNPTNKHMVQISALNLAEHFNQWEMLEVSIRFPNTQIDSCCECYSVKTLLSVCESNIGGINISLMLRKMFNLGRSQNVNFEWFRQHYFYFPL